MSDEQEIEVTQEIPREEPNTLFVRPTNAKSLGKRKVTSRFLRVMYRGSQVGIVKDKTPDTIVFTGPVYHHEFDEIMIAFKEFRGGAEVKDQHPPQMTMTENAAREKPNQDFSF